MQAIQYLDKQDNYFRQYGLDPVGGYDLSKHRKVNNYAESAICLEEKSWYRETEPVCTTMQLQFDGLVFVQWREKKDTKCSVSPNAIQQIDLGIFMKGIVFRRQTDKHFICQTHCNL
ncbi:hypothetical protein [Neisseria iguanae]|uniref:Uncharacterized protein n=1 Tax=Neisseria iguanae TaxID=90242 RepID=A0A2P7TYI8_9NEIS|nr:hypothetical protein [Neisseria iguanae]PSJ79792.1 hypothetical protein C7N83_10110 [Neisseria iguanae]